MSYGSSKGRDLRKSAQSTVQSAFYSVEGKKAKAALQEAQAALQGRSGLSSSEKVENLESARAALKVVVESKKVAGSPVADELQEARKELKKAAKQYA